MSLWKDWKLLLSVIPYFECFKNFQLIQVSYDSQEYRKIKSLFEKTMNNFCINQLQRIQNPTLWDIFQWFVSILFHYPYCMRRLVFPDLLSSIIIINIWSCQIQQSSSEAATYLSFHNHIYVFRIYITWELTNSQSRDVCLFTVSCGMKLWVTQSIVMLRTFCFAGRSQLCSRVPAEVQIELGNFPCLNQDNKFFFFVFVCLVVCLGFFVSRQKEKMKKLHQSKGVNERLLFHGTSPSHVSAICEQNFDWRLCGTHGTMYGKGTRSYFARDASYSHEYCSPHSGRYSMFVAQVLVGDFVQGKPEYCRPPPRAKNSNRLYDSCVDDPTDPSIFVIFEKQQVYPAYILEYSVETSCVVL
uniref:Poly [ADP-ribose] polymerase n=1 Tax=Cyanoderma ruficeps TaxID=181631 RepID=A0A8C3NZ07_9PASS